MALTPGGEPWLEAGRSLLEPEPEPELTVTSIEQFLSTVGITRAPEVDEPEAVEPVAVEAPTAPRPGPGARPAAAPTTPAATPDTATSKRTALQSALATIDELQAKLRAARSARSGPSTDALRVEVEQLKSLAGLDDTQLDKALRCAMEAATGFITKVGAREVHALRSGDGANDTPVQRSSDGARCMRAYVEQNTPQARRLHYWVGRGGIELSRVVMHDDVEP